MKSILARQFGQTQDFRTAAAREAVDRLNLLTNGSTATIVSLLDQTFTQHPRAICTAYRKRGEQISMEEKKALGIRANGFLSRLALSELTDLGKASPLTAHETTLLRASFSVMRYNAVQQEAQLKKQLGRCFVGFEYDVLAADCETCIALSGKVTNGSNAFVLPPPTCTCDTANYGLRQKIDWLADIT